MDTGDVLLIIFGILIGGIILSVVAYSVLRPLTRSTRAWLQEPKRSAERGSAPVPSRERRTPQPPVEGWSPESVVLRPPSGERAPITPIDDTGIPTLPLSPIDRDLLDRIRDEVLRFEERIGSKPTIHALNEGSGPQYCLHVNMPIRDASQDANAYFVCSDGFPVVPPTAIVSIAGELDPYGQAPEQEIELDLQTIRNWRADRTLLQVYEEILDRLDDGHVRVSEARSSFFARFDQYGQIVS